MARGNRISSKPLVYFQSAPGNLLDPVRGGGGITEWLWKGSDGAPVAEIDTTVFYPQGKMPLRHRLNFTMVGQRAELVDEAIENERRSWPDDHDVYFYYRYQSGHPVLNVKTAEPTVDGRVRCVPAQRPGSVSRGDVPWE